MKASNKNFEFHRTEPANEVAFGKLGYGDIFQNIVPINGDAFIKARWVEGGVVKAVALNLLDGVRHYINIDTPVILYDVDATFTSANLD